MKIFFYSLGCDKNLCDSEHMLFLLNEAGYEFTDVEEDADIIIINTCSFIGDAKMESIQEILRLSEWKTEGQCKALIATGCLSERYQEEILKELPELDGVVGTASWDHIVSVVEEALEKHEPRVFKSIDRLPESRGRILSVNSGYAYLKIAEGCRKNCTYCIIPSIRGTYRSVPMEELLKEAKGLVENGVSELILVAQETTLYGTDLYGKKTLSVLLERLSEIEDLHWIRLLYCYPEEITDELLETIKRLPKVVHYLDIPVQHASDRILKRMNRRTTKDELLDRIRHIREEIPDMALRTTLITGFPGETEDDVEELASFIRTASFERLGIFPYSREEGTPAAGMPDQIEDETKEERRDRLMLLQQDIAFKKAEAMIGRRVSCIIEGSLPEETGPEGEYVYAGRTYMDAPDVDGMIFIFSRELHMTGDIITAEVTACEDYDLTGVECYEPA